MIIVESIVRSAISDHRNGQRGSRTQGLSGWILALAKTVMPTIEQQAHRVSISSRGQ